MAEDTCVRRMVPDCGDSEQKGSAPGFCPDWDACMPFGGRLYSRDGCVRYEASGTAPADGVYDRVVVQDGCIRGVAGQEVSSYQPQPCTNSPCSCGSSSGGGGEEISPEAGNLLSRDAAGALKAKLYVAAGDGVVLSGSGTPSDPLVADADMSESPVFLQAANAGISVSGDGSQENPFRVGHADGNGEIHAGGFSFDRFGHLQSYTRPSSAGTVNGVVGRNGVKSTTDTETGIATVELEQPAVTARGTYRLGGFDVTVDEYNRVSVVDRQVEVSPGARYMGAQLVTLTDSGTIADVVDTSLDRVVVYHKASRRFTGTNSVSMTFETALVGSFRISLVAASVSSASVSVDGRAVTADVLAGGANTSPETGMPGGRVDALTSARYALGQHTVSVSGTFSGPGYLDVEIVAGY